MLQQACTKLIVNIGTLKQSWAKELRLSADTGRMDGGAYGTQLWNAYGAAPDVAPDAADPYAGDGDRGAGMGGYVDI